MVGRRDLPGRRWLSIVLRALHLAGVVLCAVGILGIGTPSPGAVALMLATGIALYALDLWQHPRLWREVAGLFVLCKLVLVAAMALVPAAAVALFWLLLLSSAVVSHAPHGFRHRRIVR
jgi:hypothetical protein